MAASKRILVATDGSAPAEVAELVAAEMGNCMSACYGGCEIVVATVIPPKEGSIVEVPFRGTVPARVQRVLPTPEMEEDAEKLVAEAGLRIKELATHRGVEVRALVLRAAAPAAGILEFIGGEEPCEYVVMGNRGHGGFRSLILGSVSNEVLNRAPCPVVITKASVD